jgi:hypothetical protein
MQAVFNKDEWTGKFIESVHKWTCQRNKSLTTDQAAAILRVFRKLKYILIRHGYTTELGAAAILDKPKYKNPLRQSLKIEREVRYAGGNRLAFRFKLNDRIKDFITQEIKPRHIFAIEYLDWDWINRLWMIEVNRETLEPAMMLIGRFGFHIDEEVENFLVDAHNAFRDPCKFRIEGNQIIVEINDNELLGEWVASALRGEEI